MAEVSKEKIIEPTWTGIKERARYDPTLQLGPTIIEELGKEGIEEVSPFVKPGVERLERGFKNILGYVGDKRIGTIGGIDPFKIVTKGEYRAPTVGELPTEVLKSLGAGAIATEEIFERRGKQAEEVTERWLSEAGVLLPEEARETWGEKTIGYIPKAVGFAPKLIAYGAAPELTLGIEATTGITKLKDVELQEKEAKRLAKEDYKEYSKTYVSEEGFRKLTEQEYITEISPQYLQQVKKQALIEVAVPIAFLGAGAIAKSVKIIRNGLPITVERVKVVPKAEEFKPIFLMEEKPFATKKIGDVTLSLFKDVEGFSRQVSTGEKVIVTLGKGTNKEKILFEGLNPYTKAAKEQREDIIKKLVKRGYSKDDAKELIRTQLPEVVEYPFKGDILTLSKGKKELALMSGARRQVYKKEIVNGLPTRIATSEVELFSGVSEPYIKKSFVKLTGKKLDDLTFKQITEFIPKRFGVKGDKTKLSFEAGKVITDKFYLTKKGVPFSKIYKGPQREVLDVLSIAKKVRETRLPEVITKGKRILRVKPSEIEPVVVRVGDVVEDVRKPFYQVTPLEDFAKVSRIGEREVKVFKDITLAKRILPTKRKDVYGADVIIKGRRVEPEKDIFSVGIKKVKDKVDKKVIDVGLQEGLQKEVLKLKEKKAGELEVATLLSIPKPEVKERIIREAFKKVEPVTKETFIPLKLTGLEVKDITLDKGVVSEVLKPSKAPPVIDKVLIPKEDIILDRKLDVGVDVKRIQDIGVVTKVVKDIARVTARQFDIGTIYKLETKLKPKLETKLKTKLKLKIKPKLRPILKPRVKPKIKPKQPKPTPKVFPLIIFPIPSKKKPIKKKKVVPRTEKGYVPYVIRGGKKVYIGKPQTREDALMKGQKNVLETAAVTFGAEPTTKKVKFKRDKPFKPSPKVRDYRVVSGKKVKLTNEFIQKRKARISAPGEKAAIPLKAKRIKKVKKSKSTGGFFK